MEDKENDRRENIKAQKRQFDIKHRQTERLFQKQHAMRGRASRYRQIDHENEKTEPQGLRALGRMVERVGQRLGLLCIRHAGFRVIRQLVEHRRCPPAKA
jgi:hypothetical protein